MEDEIKVLIVDDHLMFLEGLQALLDNEPYIKVIGVATNCDQAINFLNNTAMDMVITDISMPEKDGSFLVEIIQNKFPQIHTLVLSMHSEPYVISKLIKQNVNGYLLKNAEKEELLKAIRTIANGENYFSNEVSKIYMENSLSRNKPENRIPKLSKREIDVIKLILDECNTKEIADLLFISQHTVESHRKNILSKLNVKNVAGLVKLVIELDLLAKSNEQSN